MTRERRRDHRAEQHARTQGAGRIQQFAGDQYNIISTATGPVPQATAALPVPPAHLVGRTSEAEKLLELLDPAGQGPSAVVVSAVSGLAGIGKTALALHVAHEAAIVRNWYPGGVLFVNLRGYDPEGQVTGGQALAALLRALGVRDKDLPSTTDEQAAVYRSELARMADQGRRVLLVADNASTTAQVSVLIPARREHRLVVTSRDILAALPARQVGLHELAPGPARELISDSLTRARPEDPRPSREPEALDEVVRHCGRLPLALEIAAARLTGDPGLSLAAFATELADSQGRLEHLSYDDGGHSLAVRAAFEGSYRRLDPAQALLFRLLSINPGPDLATDTAAALIGRPARGLLADLARMALLSEQPVGAERWRMHDLIRLYAAELAEDDDARVREEAADRLLEHYAMTFEAATALLVDSPEEHSRRRFASRGEALSWLKDERANLTAVAQTFAVSHPNVVVRIAFDLVHRLFQWRYFDDGTAVAEAALAVADDHGTASDRGGLHTILGMALFGAGRRAEAVAATQESIRIYRELARKRPDAEPLVGRSLANLGFLEPDPEKRRAAAEEAISIGRRWRRWDDPVHPHVELAGALHNLSVALTDLGRHAEAVAPAQEAMEIRRRQAQVAPGGFQRYFADLLIHLSAKLLEAGRPEDAVLRAVEGVDVFDQLAAEDPRAHEHALCEAVARLGLAYVAVGRTAEARERHTQATAMAARLTENAEVNAALTELTHSLLPTAERRGPWHRITSSLWGRRSL
ncbi:tetratricopeptide repeat protein [Streptomyces sp. VNUA24]|uniref:ATP-binding protein n=1 Tax=Streptomyces sp. VNUA24 TaxID=3031131 RepID=UPI0023B7E4E9|nr:tetratricopeptide repeat protein [Streptomyces sp. VNUA24]WEH12309.1 tetratricopeptide repeat protein [Streptomyces sp. VNUA24]